MANLIANGLLTVRPDYLVVTYFLEDKISRKIMSHIFFRIFRDL